MFEYVSRLFSQEPCVTVGFFTHRIYNIFLYEQDGSGESPFGRRYEGRKKGLEKGSKIVSQGLCKRSRNVTKIKSADLLHLQTQREYVYSHDSGEKSLGPVASRTFRHFPLFPGYLSYSRPTLYTPYLSVSVVDTRVAKNDESKQEPFRVLPSMQLLFRSDGRSRPRLSPGPEPSCLPPDLTCPGQGTYV